jgi:hypothetical protein
MGDAHNKLEPVEPAVPYVLRKGARLAAESPGRRAAFANWLASAENPLTARVMANRIWQYRMGDGGAPERPGRWRTAGATPLPTSWRRSPPRAAERGGWIG